MAKSAVRSSRVRVRPGRCWGLILALAGVVVLPAIALGQPAARPTTQPAGRPTAGKPQTETTSRVSLRNYPLNSFVRMLDGQWQGIRLAADGNVYFGGGSHSAHVGAAFFKYAPPTAQLSLLAQDMTTVCHEDPAKVPTQGKIHSDVAELDGWIYFGTHLSDYTSQGQAAYTGGHLMGYELASGKFRDFGVIHKNYTNYAGLALDAPRKVIYFYVTPFGEGDGSHLYRVDIESGKKQDLGLVAAWTNRREHGPPCYHMFVDGRGDCWLTVRAQPHLYVARAKTGKIERFDNALPQEMQKYSRDPWQGAVALDADRALLLMNDAFWIFDSSKFDGSTASTPPSGTSKAFTALNVPPAQTGQRASRDNLAVAGGLRGRFYWTEGGGQRTATHLCSATVDNPAARIDHGALIEADGRTPWFIGSLEPDGAGKVYMVGRWNVTDAEMATIGVKRNNTKVAVFFTVADVSKDLH